MTHRMKILSQHAESYFVSYLTVSTKISLWFPPKNFNSSRCRYYENSHFTDNQYQVPFSLMTMYFIVSWQMKSSKIMSKFIFLALMFGEHYSSNVWKCDLVFCRPFCILPIYKFTLNNRNMFLKKYFVCLLCNLYHCEMCFSLASTIMNYWMCIDQ